VQNNGEHKKNNDVYVCVCVCVYIYIYATTEMQTFLRFEHMRITKRNEVHDEVMKKINTGNS